MCERGSKQEISFIPKLPWSFPVQTNPVRLGAYFFPLHKVLNLLGPEKLKSENKWLSIQYESVYLCVCETRLEQEAGLAALSTSDWLLILCRTSWPGFNM